MSSICGEGEVGAGVGGATVLARPIPIHKPPLICLSVMWACQLAGMKGSQGEGSHLEEGEGEGALTHHPCIMKEHNPSQVYPLPQVCLSI